MTTKRSPTIKEHLEDHFGISFGGLQTTQPRIGESKKATHMEITLHGPEERIQNILSKLALNKELKKIDTHGYSKGKTAILPYGNGLLVTIPFKSALAMKIGAPEIKTQDKPR